MYVIDPEDISKGTKAEEHFLNLDLYSLFHETRHTVIDLRERKREGELLLPDGRLLEIKSDGGGLEQKGNVFVEIAHKSHEGWYRHCQQNGVDGLIVEAFRGVKRHPYGVIYIPFRELVDLIETEGDTFTKTRKGDGLLVPVVRIFESCQGAQALASIILKKEDMEEITDIARKALESMGVDGQIRAEDMFTQLSTQAEAE